MKKISAAFFAIGWLAIFVCGFLAYMVVNYDRTTEIATDGLGRRLSDAPWIARVFLLGSRDWAGIKWFFGDYIIFWGWVAVTIGLSKVGNRKVK